MHQIIFESTTILKYTFEFLRMVGQPQHYNHFIKVLNKVYFFIFSNFVLILVKVLVILCCVFPIFSSSGFNLSICLSIYIFLLNILFSFSYSS